MGETMNTDRNAEIYRRQGSGETLAAIAREFGISRERVRQICFDQYARIKHNEKAAAAKIEPENTELYDWIMYQTFDTEYDSRIRTRAYNAVRLAYLKKNKDGGTPTVDFLLEMDIYAIKRIRGIGTVTVALLMDVKRKIEEIQVEKQEGEIARAGRFTLVGLDGKVRLRSTVNKDAALCRLYAYENTRCSPVDIYMQRNDLALAAGEVYLPRVMDRNELRGMMARESIFIEFREHPELNGNRKWIEMPDIPHVSFDDYLVWWRGWTHEPDLEQIQGTLWEESNNEQAAQ